MKIKIENESQKGIKSYAGNEHEYAEFINAELIVNHNFIEIEIPLSDRFLNEIRETQESDFDKNSVCFGLTKKQSIVLGKFLIAISK